MIMRNVGAFLILLLGVGGAFGIALRASSLRAPRSSPAVLAAALPYVAEFTPPLSDQAVGAVGTNLTDALARSYGEEIARINAYRAGTGDTASPLHLPPADSFWTLLDEHLAHDLGISLFSSEDVVTTPDSPETLRNYFASLSRVLETPSSPSSHYLTAFARMVDEDNPEPLRQYASFLSARIAGVLALPVPFSFRDFHLAFLNILQRKRQLAEMVLAAPEDPVRSIAAIEELSRVAEEESAFLAAFQRLLGA